MTRKLSGITGIKEDVRTFTFSDKLADNRTMVGIEVEAEHAEGLRAYTPLFTYWSEVQENSLRNEGIELITLPVLGGDIIEALDEFKLCIDSLQHKPVVSERTGLHVHLDFRSETVQTLFKFIIIYLVFEKLLFDHCEAGREHNAYCVPLGMCEELLHTLPDILSRSDRKSLHALSHFPKYTAINLRTLCSLGTVEFRAHEGTTDSAVILQWINLLLSIKKFATECKRSPQDLIDFVCASPEEYYNQVFGEYCTVKYSNEVFEGMLEGARAAQYMYRAKDISTVPEQESLLQALYAIPEQNSTKTYKYRPHYIAIDNAVPAGDLSSLVPATGAPSDPRDNF